MTTAEYDGTPGLVEAKTAHGETTLIVESASSPLGDCPAPQAEGTVAA